MGHNKCPLFKKEGRGGGSNKFYPILRWGGVSDPRFSHFVAHFCSNKTQIEIYFISCMTQTNHSNALLYKNMVNRPYNKLGILI